jgi:hypothetical protein
MSHNYTSSEYFAQEFARFLDSYLTKYGGRWEVSHRGINHVDFTISGVKCDLEFCVENNRLLTCLEINDSGERVRPMRAAIKICRSRSGRVSPITWDVLKKEYASLFDGFIKEQIKRTLSDSK